MVRGQARGTNFHPWFQLPGARELIRALLAKTSVVMLPFILPALTWWLAKSIRIKRLLALLPFFITAILPGLAPEESSQKCQRDQPAWAGLLWPGIRCSYHFRDRALIRVKASWVSARVVLTQCRLAFVGLRCVSRVSRCSARTGAGRISLIWSWS